jgi:hypothetical protein
MSKIKFNGEKEKEKRKNSSFHYPIPGLRGRRP